MKLIIAGSRGVMPTLEEITNSISDAFGVGALLLIEEIISGDCPNSPDIAGIEYGLTRGYHLKHFPADWTKHGKVAGKLRNREMADYGTHAIVFWDGMSSGSCDMVTRMVARQKPVWVVPMRAA